jgi:nucleoid-associated protein YgaU
LFNQLGQPLRAKVSATFLEVPKPPAKQSPDLTKIHLVTAGDTIYNIAKAEYDDESFYLQIAQANDLKNYRKLVPGQKLVLPPIAKTE